MITSTYLPTKEILQYLLEHATILHVKQFCQRHLANKRAKPDYLALLQLGLTCMYFYSREIQYSVFFHLHVVHQVNVDICINHFQAVRSPLNVFQITISTLIHLADNFVKIFDLNYQYVLKLFKFLSIHGLKQLFYQLLVKGFHKSCVSVLVFCSLNVTIVFFKQLSHFTFKLRPIITLK